MKKFYAFAFALALSFVVSSAALAQGGSGTGTGLGTGMGQGNSTGLGTGMNKGNGNGMGAGSDMFGKPVADFTLPDTSGQSHTLASLKGKNGTVLIFVSTQCPVSNAYNERMEKLAQDYKDKGVAVIGINSNKAESPDDIKAHAAQNNLTFKILKDKGNKVADQLGATTTPEVFFLDAKGNLVYRGRIDNARNAESVSVNDLRDAIEAVLAGKAVVNAFVRAFGCTIKRG